MNFFYLLLIGVGRFADQFPTPNTVWCKHCSKERARPWWQHRRCHPPWSQRAWDTHV